MTDNRIGNKVVIYLKNNKFAFIISAMYFLISIFLRSILLNAFRSLYEGGYFNDSDRYTYLAENLLKKFSYSLDGVEAHCTTPPGYPFFLAFCYGLGFNDKMIMALQYFFGAIIIFLLCRTCKIYRLSKKASIVVMLFSILNLEAFIHNGAILTENIYCLCLVAALYLWAKYFIVTKKKTYFLLFSLFFAAGMLVKPILVPFALVVLAVFIVLAVLKIIGIKEVIIYALCIFTVIGGWSYRNYTITGMFEYNYRFKLDAYRVLARNVEVNRTGTYKPSPSFEEGIEQIEPYLERYITEEELADKEEYVVAEYYEKAAKDYIGDHIFDTIKLCFKTTATMLLGPMRDFWDGLFGKGTLVSKLTANLYTVFLVCEYLVYLYCLITNFKKLGLVDLSVFGYILYAVVASSTNFGSRYRLGFIYVIYFGIAMALSKYPYREAECA